MLLREGGWNWGDWGTDIDIVPLQNCWYYLMLKCMRNTAQILGKKEDAKRYAEQMSALKQAFNAHFWTGSEYRDPQYEDATDDRIHALAVVSGLADRDKYPAILEVFLHAGTRQSLHGKICTRGHAANGSRSRRARAA